jgi:hypothetical protein
MEARDCKCPGSSCMLSIVVLEDDVSPASLVLHTSTFCDASVDTDVCFSVNTGHLFVLRLSLWELMSKVHIYVFVLADHCTHTPRKGPFVRVYT